MINETITQIIVNGSAPIPLVVTLTQSTNWTQFFTTILIGLFSSFGLIIIIYGPQMFRSFKSVGLSKISKITQRNVILIKHTRSDFFSSSMIDEKTLREITFILNKFKGEPFDLILHTPGGEIFSSLAISRILKQYPGAIRAVIPLYSMSGGTLLALSCKELLMTPNACIGPIDPQLGNLFRYGSARSWDEIVKFKGKKAEDQSISFAMMGKQYTKSIKNHLLSTIDFGLSSKQKDKLVTFLTDGEIEHAYPMTPTNLQGFGIKASTLDHPKLLKYLNKIISSPSKEGVHYYRFKNKKWWNKL